MVYLEFAERQVLLKDEWGRVLWENAPDGMWHCWYCGTYVDKKVSLCPFCGGGRKPKGMTLPKDWDQLARRAVLRISFQAAKSLRNKRIPLPDGTKIYGTGICEDFWTDSYIVRVMHPDLFFLQEGERLPVVAPVFEETATGGLRFVSWYADY